MVREVRTLSCNDAMRIIEAIIAQAKKTGAKASSIAVAGADGEIIAFASMDGALIASRKIARAKAHSSVVMGRDTMDWEESEKPVDGRNFCDPDFTTFGGGVVIKDDQYILGGIGVSGGTSEEDESLAKFGRAFIEKSIPRGQLDMG